MQEVRSTRAKCNYLDAKYQDVLSQVDDMVRFCTRTSDWLPRNRVTAQH